MVCRSIHGQESKISDFLIGRDQQILVYAVVAHRGRRPFVLDRYNCGIRDGRIGLDDVNFVDCAAALLEGSPITRRRALVLNESDQCEVSTGDSSSVLLVQILGDVIARVNMIEPTTTNGFFDGRSLVGLDLKYMYNYCERQ